MSQQVDKKDQVEAMDIVHEDEDTKQKRIAKETITGNYNVYIEKTLYLTLKCRHKAQFLFIRAFSRNYRGSIHHSCTENTSFYPTSFNVCNTCSSYF